MNSSYFKNSETPIDIETVTRVVQTSISKIRNSLLSEEWLPLGLRSVIAIEIGSIDEALAKRPVNDRIITQRLERLVDALGEYKVFHEKSEVIRLIKILYLMVENFHEPNRVDSSNSDTSSSSQYLEKAS